MNTLVDMISGMEVKEDDDDFMNAVDYMFAGLEKRKPDCFAVKQYKKYKLASGKTARSILISCGARLTPFDMEYLEFRSAMGYSNEHEQQLQHFDRYCYEHCPEQTELTKEVVRGWFYDEIARGRSCLSSKAAAIRLFAKYLGVSADILPMSCVPKTPGYLPYILTDSELATLFHAADTMEYKNDPFFRETASVLLRLLYSCGLRPNEGRNIKLEHINFKTGELFITKPNAGKNGSS